MNSPFDILVIGSWCGFASLGFGILFNTPARILFVSWAGGFLAGCIKFALLEVQGGGVISASFLAAVAVGIASIPVAHYRHVPPMIFSIPSVIPLVPGVYAYRTMLGLMKLARPAGEDYSSILQSAVQNGMNTLFIIMALALGVAVPMHVMRKHSVKQIRWPRP
jgi:uncharacterized membrane protein YjjB (DUF3815 family)